MEIIDIEKLEMNTTENAIEVRVIRRWSTRLKPDETSYIVIDKYGDAIQMTATAAYRTTSNCQPQLLNCYRISKFICCEPPSYLKSVSHPLGIIIGPAAVVTPIEDSRLHPMNYFEFTSYDNLIPSTDTEDIITGCLEDQFEGTTTKKDPYIRLTLKNDRGNIIKVTLWKEIMQSRKRFDRTAVECSLYPSTIAVTSVKVTKPYDWIQLSSTVATYVYLNPDVPASSSLLNDVTATTDSAALNRPVPLLSSSTENKTICELLQLDRVHAANRIFTCDAKICDFAPDEPWLKTFCSFANCKQPVFKRSDNWYCPTHWKSSTCIYMYHLSTTITDSSGSANATIYDDAARTLVGRPCSDLATPDAESTPTTIPLTLLQLKERVFRFHLKVQLYTKVGYTGFTVTRVENQSGTSVSATPTTPAATTQSIRRTPTCGVKRSLATSIGTTSEADQNNNPSL